MNEPIELTNKPITDSHSIAKVQPIIDTIVGMATKGRTSSLAEAQHAVSNWQASPLHPYWLSWYSPSGYAWECGWPWWISGYDADDRATIVCAIRAESQEAAWAYIHGSYDDPNVPIEYRFIEPIAEPGWTPYIDRFPKADWMMWPECAETPTRRGDVVTDPASGELNDVDREVAAAVELHALGNAMASALAATLAVGALEDHPEQSERCAAALHAWGTATGMYQ